MYSVYHNLRMYFAIHMSIHCCTYAVTLMPGRLSRVRWW